MTPIIAVAWAQPDYLSSLKRAGAKARELDPARDRLPDVLDACDGVLLTGGADVDPAHYGVVDRHPTTKPDPARDEYELALAREAMARDLPLFAICRGVQILNVAAGGTLVQDIPSERSSTVVHRLAEPPTSTPHTVDVRGDSRLAGLIGAPARSHALPVNSRHHQGIDRVAPAFLVSATAPDGLVEAIERSGARFCVGVQWHPESFWRTGEFLPMFKGLVAAARRASRDRVRQT